jgi:mannose-6-phosphate isomerase-like protein (cupin superfamily)
MFDKLSRRKSMIHYSLPSKDSDRNRQDFSAVDLPLPSAAMNAAEITLTGRYPETGFALNKKSEMIVRILEGSTIFHSEGEEIELPEGATVLVQTGKKYCWIPKGSVTLYAVSSPPWTPEQHESLPE